MTNERHAEMRRQIEADLVQHPDDRVAHSAYADLLSESLDPAEAARGDFIAVQLALEDEGRPAPELRRLEQKEQELLQAHQRTWLGGLAPFLLREAIEPSELRDDFRFRRGWLDALRVGCLALPLARVLRKAPEARLLRELTIEQATDDSEDVAHEPADGIPHSDHTVGLCPLVGSPVLSNVRSLQLGPDAGDNDLGYHCTFHTSVVPALLRCMPRLEDLRLFVNRFDLTEVFALPLASLRFLLVYHIDQVHRLHVLADNPAMGNLTHLRLHPHHLAWHRNQQSDEADGYVEREGYIPLREVQALLRSPHLTSLTDLQLRVSSLGDAGCEEIVRSGILKRLKSLDLRHGRITDAGARALAACPDLRNLTWLDVARNALGEEGVSLIEALNIPGHAGYQRDPSEEAPRRHDHDFGIAPEDAYLTEGEFE